MTSINNDLLPDKHGMLSNPLILTIKNPKRSKDPAIQSEQQILSYADLSDLIEATAQQLTNCGLKKGDRALIIFENSAEHILAALTILSIGAIVVPISPDSPERTSTIANEISPRLCLTGPEVSISLPIQTHQLQLNFSTKSVTLTSGNDSLSEPIVSSTTDTSNNSDTFIRFTSGSTGHPKGAILNKDHLLWTTKTLSTLFGFNPQHRELLIAPIAYSGGWQRVVATLYSGGSIIIPKGPITASGILEDIESYKISGFFTPPPLVRMLLASDSEKTRQILSHCKTIEIGSAPLTEQELKKLISLAPQTNIFIHYGMTECSRAVILDTRKNFDKLATVGRPAPGVELKIIDGDGKMLDTGKTGEIYLKGRQQATEYWNQPELTAERFIDGWIATGDFGKLDELGFLTYLGRQDDMINCGGFSYFPAEVEAELGQMESVKQYLIAGVSDSRKIQGHVPWAFVIPEEPESYVLQKFLSIARKKLAPHKVPRWVVVIPELPVTATGKPDRHRAVQLYSTKTSK